MHSPMDLQIILKMGYVLVYCGRRRATTAVLKEQTGVLPVGLPLQASRATRFKTWRPYIDLPIQVVLCCFLPVHVSDGQE